MLYLYLPRFNTDNGIPVLRGCARVLLRTGRIILQDTSSADLRGNSHADLRGNSHADLRDNSSADLWDNSRAVLQGNSSAVLYDFSSVFHKSSGNVTTISPVAREIIYPSDIETWCKLKGISITNEKINLFKITKADGTDYKTGTINYLSGTWVEAPDWDPTYEEECGKGLHLADSPKAALIFAGSRDCRLFEVEAYISECVVFGGTPEYPMKLRAKRCRILRELNVKEFGYGKRD